MTSETPEPKMEVSVMFDDDGLHLYCGDDIEEIVETVWTVQPTDEFVNAAARLFQKLTGSGRTMAAAEPSDAAHALAGSLGRRFCRRIADIPEEAVVENVIEEELREMIAKEFDPP